MMIRKSSILSISALLLVMYAWYHIQGLHVCIIFIILWGPSL